MKQTAQRYLESQVLTAPPERLVVLLYDGAIRFALRAAEAIDKKDMEEAGTLLIRAQRIILELLCALRPEANREVSGNLTRLYGFVYEELVWANVERDAARIRKVVPVLETLREGWASAVDKIKKEEAP